MKRFVCLINSLLMRIGKPLAVTGVVFILVILMGTCGDDELAEAADDTEYTDVEYSQDGTGVTLYLDGKGVPKTRSQRAITKDLAQAAFDYIEVIFVNGAATTAGNVARTAWTLGQPANIVNIDRGTTGVNYGSTSAACMFVGKEDGKVLLGVGKLTKTTPGGNTTIDANTVSVTFSIAALKTGLLIGDETATSPPTVNGFSVAADSFTYTGRATAGNSFRKALPPTGSVLYPVYVIPSTAGTTTATYTFSFFGISTNFTIGDCLSPIKHVDTTIGSPVVQKKTPRYAINGRYEEPRNRIDTYTTVTFNSYAPGGGTSFGGGTNAAIPLVFTTTANSGGFFAFNMQIPVYMVSSTAAGRNNGTGPVTWFIRTGVGSEFYSLDDGVSRGGCVFISVGISEAEFNSIEWTWFKGF